MDPVMLMFTILGVALAVVLIGFAAILFLVKRSYVFTVHKHEAVAKITWKGFFLYVDGKLEQQLSGRGMSRVTLRATVDGEEFKVHISAVGLFRLSVEATLGGREVPATRVAK